jgi:hypothetical protein
MPAVPGKDVALEKQFPFLQLVTRMFSTGEYLGSSVLGPVREKFRQDAKCSKSNCKVYYERNVV